MGIKGIYGELGPGQRVSLSKLAADTLRAEGRPLRLAIDVAIWQFQAQAAKGGMNPAIRTLFYRLVRLLAIPIQPVFVFDGHNKPTTKRNRRSGRGDGMANSQAKRLIRLFGLPILDAPGEAEAECALLQRHGIVDAVLSEDVDTIMFGCTKTLRNWSTESKGSTAPTHVSLYDAADVESHGLDRQGMVLVALMSGGDYLPDGIPGCGVKVAYEAACAGFGASLCKLKASDVDGVDAWREKLRHELTTNESGHFRIKHKSLHIPDDFPNMQTLRYYTHPVVSPQSNLEQIREKVLHDQAIDLESLREFTRETFDWDFRTGAVKFIRVLGQAMLVQNLMRSQNMIQGISIRRTHFSTDATPELRISYIPQDVVPIDISKEVEDAEFDRDGLALNSDDEFSPPQGKEAKTPQAFDITVPELTWVLEDTTEHFAPESIRKWEAAKATKALEKEAKKKKKSPKKTSKTAKTATTTTATTRTKTRTKKTEKQVKGTEKSNGTIGEYFGISKKSSTSAARAATAKKTRTSPEQETCSPPPAKSSTTVEKRSPRRRLAKTPPMSSSPPPPSSPPSPSKQTGALAQSSSPYKDAARLPPWPRPSQRTACSEAIVISSSPPGSPAPATTAKRARTAPDFPEAHAGSVHWQLAPDPSPLIRGEASSSSEEESRVESSEAPVRIFASSSTAKPVKYTQLSLDAMFTAAKRRSVESRAGDPCVPATTRICTFERQNSSPVGGDDEDEDDEDLLGVPLLSDLLKCAEKTLPSGKHVSSDEKQQAVDCRSGASSSSSSSSGEKKKLLVSSGLGFLREIELDTADERDELMAREEARLDGGGGGGGSESKGKGKMTTMTRWSDASFIDLTEE